MPSLRASSAAIRASPQVGLPLNVKVDAGRRAVLNDLLAVYQHFEFCHARPLHAAYGLAGFSDGILSSLSETLFGRADDIDNFLSHGASLLELGYIVSQDRKHDRRPRKD